MIETLLKIGAFLMSSMGYWEFFRRKYKVEVYFLPAFTISVHFMILFAAGILNILLHTAAVVYVGGLLLFLDAVRRQRYRVFVPYWNVGYAFLIIGTGLVLVAVKGQIFAHYDNFSHWAIVVKNMLATDRFPNFLDEVIMFQNYPLGSSVYIYYFCKMTYSGESAQMLAQAFMMLCMLLPWFAYAGKNRLASAAVFALAANFLLCYNIEIYDLLVDTLLPLAGMAALVFTYRLCYLLDEGNRADIYCVIPFLFLVSQIKNSGIYFVALATVMLLVSARKADMGKHLAVCVSPFIGLYLWDRHCDYVFVRAASSKHAMAVENYTAVFREKEPEDILRILEGVIEYVAGRQGMVFLLVWLALFAAAAWAAEVSDRKGYLRLLLCVVGMYVVYTIGMVGMYVFSMPLTEAFGSMERYMKTIDIAIYYLFVCYGSMLLSRMGRSWLHGAVGAVMASLLVVTWWVGTGGFCHIFRQNNPESLAYREDRIKLQTLLEEYEVPAECSYLLCIPEYNSYEYFLCQYLLDSSIIHNPKITDASQLEDAQFYQNMVILEEGNPIIDTWIQENYPEQAGQRVICLEMSIDRG